jgi:hypothetical protein
VEAVFNASAQNWSDVLHSLSIVLAMLMNVMFFLSTTHILLWCVRRGQLMLGTFPLKILFYLQVLEHCVVVTLDVFDPQVKLIVSSPQETLESPLGSLLSCKKNTQVKHV